MKPFCVDVPVRGTGTLRPKLASGMDHTKIQARSMIGKNTGMRYVSGFPNGDLSDKMAKQIAPRRGRPRLRASPHEVLSD